MQVLVLDRKGRPVADLKRGDFRLHVNGRPWPIDWIEPPALEESQPSRPSPARPVQEAAPVAPTAVRFSHAPRSTVYLIDDFHLDYGSRRARLLAMQRHLETLPPDEEVAVYVFDPFGFSVLSPIPR